MNPIPPISIKHIKTTFPNIVNCSAGIIVFKPVTHTADVAVNRLSTNFMCFPETLLIGNFNKIAPIKILAITPNTKICGAVNFILLPFFLDLCFYLNILHINIINSINILVCAIPAKFPSYKSSYIC